jgi:predicted permease
MNPNGIWRRYDRLLGPDTASDVRDELRFHIEAKVADLMRHGFKEDEARQEAERQFGNLGTVQLEGERLGGRKERRKRLGERWSDVTHDVQFSLRQMRKAPAFTITAVLTLALGIGANAVIYTLVDSILLRPLPYARQDRLMRITGTTMPAVPKGWIRELGTNSKAFSSIAGYGMDAESNVADNDTPDRVFGASVTVNAFDTLGIQPTLGDFFTPDDAIAGQDHDVVLSYGYWMQRYGGATWALGHTIRVDGISRRIIGVMPAGVRFPYADTQFVIPVSYNRAQPLDPWSTFDLRVFGRLADGVVPGQAQAELRRLHGILLPLFPWRMPDIWASDMTVTPLLEAQTGAMRPRLLLLFGAVGLILLIACANVANLMLARANARERELAIRGALGASALRLIQQLLSEAVVLGVLAGLVGLGAAFASLRLFLRLLPADTPRIQDVSLHAGDVLFTLGASVLAGVLFGLIPSIKMASLNRLATLRLGGRGLTGKNAGYRVSMVLVIAQIGLSVMVITAAGLMLHSLYRISQVDPGFRSDHTITAEVALDKDACHEKGRCTSFFETLLARAQSIPGVESLALTDSLPLSGRTDNYVFDAENHPREPRQGALLATGRTVSPGYFGVLGLHLLKGRLLTQEDASGATHAAVISQHMAEHVWPNQDPIGKHLLSVLDEPSPAVWAADKASIVVGVVANAREQSLEEGSSDEVYLPMSPVLEQPVMYVLLHSHTTPAETAAALRRAVAGIDSLVPVTHVRALDQIVATSVAAPRALAVLLVGFGSLAVIIGAIGVYSLISYIVSWRTSEIGLRLALGAERWQIEMAIARQSLLLAGLGCLAGLAGALALGKVLRRFLFEVSALDPMTLFAVAVLMLLVALVAAWAPARRAAAVDPLVALRVE